ncbi:phosphatidylinositol-glycan biosynthesis class F protein [Neodiprion lecontei]|uniref:Phosphatidylinositol-glycan biosynthesis class F protein n=1 Tax=Neodiprion lecontei TaxID=441921 RepID=A0A6J0BVG9_NEOLC|nr:phosphatidylinositol-glycan biosynthesis class F protein [Neodiprion lecontei]
MLDEDYLPKQRLLLFYCFFTCIYFPGILILLKFNDNIYNVGTYKFIPILIILMFAEVTKLSFSLLQTDLPTLSKIDSKSITKARKSWSKRFKDIFKFLVSSVVMALIYYIIVILFGCPLLTHHEETIMLTLTLTSLTLIPASLHLGVDESIALLTGAPLQSSNVLVEAVKRNIQATLLGTWLGATVIPLDWNRPWQAWPIPCITGALIGYMIAHFFTLIKMVPFLPKKKNHYSNNIK